MQRSVIWKMCKLLRFHQNLNQGVLLTIKKHHIERLSMLVASKKLLVRWVNGVTEKKQFRKKLSRIFQLLPHIVEHSSITGRVESFWRDIYGSPQPLNRDTSALTQLKAFYRRLSQPEPEILSQTITAEEVRGALEGSMESATKGPDGLNEFWWNNSTSIHTYLDRIFNTWIESSITLIGLSMDVSC